MDEKANSILLGQEDKIISCWCEKASKGRRTHLKLHVQKPVTGK